MWPVLAMALLVAAELPQPLELGPAQASITLIAPGDAGLRRRVQQVAADPGETLVLRIGRLAAATDHAASWEVHAVSAGENVTAGPNSLIGVMSTYGLGPGTGFTFAMDAVLDDGDCEGLRIVFVPVSGMDQGGEGRPLDTGARVTIGAISLEVESANP